jgi:hypothetical protein
MPSSVGSHSTVSLPSGTDILGPCNGGQVHPVGEVFVGLALPSSRQRGRHLAESLRRALEPRASGGLRGGAGEEIVGLDDEWTPAKRDEELAGFSEALLRFHLPADREEAPADAHD